MRVVLTRPAHEAHRWREALTARGFQVQLLPLIAIEPLPTSPQIDAARQALARCGAAMFVSANAVQHFLGAEVRWPATTRAWATGAGTASALQAAGVPVDLIDRPAADAHQFDSETLWVQVAGQVGPGSRVLIVRGAGADGQPGGRDWLARRLSDEGAIVEIVAAYRRVLPSWTDHERAVAQGAAHDGSVWVFSSSEAIGNLRALLPSTSWASARAVATHERIAQAAREAGFGVVSPSRPTEDAVAAVLESFR
ncbi:MULTISPECIES: uroporphyrinogen-III synthase [Ramlibacter]|uniref:Uroporphyrinogen-III synthase n=1 Tax=Ramlibacter pinisoli TaxID=2682844 RepID=A0A6N8ITD4_9BURK|nr:MULTISPECIES: uroporphyrinogen-III synthase [Ramlibacter]MBA2964187.1 uroporphyrinogen-III synthase [Ramlibacter sp. CGMCC 1.13660]MVQ29153.1 uroporphyrinogen-III synthase [Ramlibacter pinisoli]